MNDLAYLEQVEAHADEGLIGEVAARAVLAIALRLARALSSKAPPVSDGLGPLSETLPEPPTLDDGKGS